MEVKWFSKNIENVWYEVLAQKRKILGNSLDTAGLSLTLEVNLNFKCFKI